MNTTAAEQLELAMRSQIRNNHRIQRVDRLRRARWWFTKMRQAVDLALPSVPATAVPPTQTYLHIEQSDFLLGNQR